MKFISEAYSRGLWVLSPPWISEIYGFQGGFQAPTGAEPLPIMKKVVSAPLDKFLNTPLNFIFKCYLGSKEERFSPSSTSSQTPPPSDRKYSSLKIADLNQSGSSESDKTGSCHSSILRSQSSQLLAKVPFITSPL